MQMINDVMSWKGKVPLTIMLLPLWITIEVVETGMYIIKTNKYKPSFENSFSWLYEKNRY